MDVQRYCIYQIILSNDLSINANKTTQIYFYLLYRRIGFIFGFFLYYLMEILNDTHFMRYALQEARLAYAADEVPVGAVLVCRNQIIAKAHNQTEQLKDPTAHAELLGITAACHHLGSRYLSQCVLYVTLEPCVMCAAALNWAQLGKLVYGATDEKRGFKCIHQPLLHPKTAVIGGVLQEDCAALLLDFFKQKRN